MILYSLQPELQIAGGTDIYFMREIRVGEGDEEENKNKKKNVEEKGNWNGQGSGQVNLLKVQKEEGECKEAKKELLMSNMFPTSWQGGGDEDDDYNNNNNNKDNTMQFRGYRRWLWIG